MNKENKQLQTDAQRTNFLKALNIGFFGGMIWSSLFIFMHLFKMTEVDPFFIFKFTFGDSPWIHKWYTYITLIITYGLISIPIAIIYYYLLRRKRSWIYGVIYGVLLWVIFYYIIPILVIAFNPFLHYEAQTHISIICLMVLYGVFIGYSISYNHEYVQIELKKKS